MRFISKMFLTVLLSQVPQFLLPAQAQQAKQSRAVAIVRLGNEYSGNYLTLSEDDSAVIMEDLTRSRRQLWKLTILDDKRVRMTNVYLGDDKSLDSNEEGELFMGDTGDYAGQLWSGMELGERTVRLWNDMTGKEKSLDVVKNGDEYSVIFRKTGNFKGQVWRVTEVKQEKK